jgi:hypothetical protein
MSGTGMLRTTPTALVHQSYIHRSPAPIQKSLRRVPLTAAAGPTPKPKLGPSIGPWITPS